MKIEVKNKMEKKEIVWKDRRIINNTLIIISIIVTAFGIFLFLYNLEGYIEKLEATLAILVGVFSTYFYLIRKVTIISSLGVFIGNVTAKKWNSLNLRKRQFISWEITSSINLVNHEVKGSRGSWPRAFIELKTNNGKKYECVVYDPQGFIQALKKLNKYHLLSKDSRYR